MFDFLNIFDMLTFVTFSIRGQSTSPINSLSTVADMKHIFRFITQCYTISIIDIINKCTNSEVALKICPFCKLHANILYTFCINVCEYQIPTSFKFTVRQTRFEKFMNPSLLLETLSPISLIYIAFFEQTVCEN